VSENTNDEFVLLPSSSDNANMILDVRYSGIHDLGYSNESGRHHRPTEPRETLRCEEVDGTYAASGPDHETGLNAVSAPFCMDGPPGDEADRPGNLVDFLPR